MYTESPERSFFKRFRMIWLRRCSAAEAAKKEELKWAKQLKAVVRAQLAEGKNEAAKAILSELAGMLPEDEEVKGLLQNIK